MPGELLAGGDQSPSPNPIISTVAAKLIGLPTQIALNNNSAVTDSFRNCLQTNRLFSFNKAM
jgi:hypothetical protein